MAQSSMSKKALYQNTIDAGAAARPFSEAFMFASVGTCPETYNTNYDQYQRHAHIDSIALGNPGSASPCAQFTGQHLQRRLQVENSVERQFIDFSTEPRYAYDTSGAGKDLQECRSGGVDCSGAWKTNNMPRQNAGASCGQAPQGHFMKSLSVPGVSGSLAPMYSNQYTG